MSGADPQMHKPIVSIDGVLHYHLYNQDGRLVEATCADTPSFRRFVEWVRRHDRHTGSIAEAAE